MQKKTNSWRVSNLNSRGHKCEIAENLIKTYTKEELHTTTMGNNNITENQYQSLNELQHILLPIRLRWMTINFTLSKYLFLPLWKFVKHILDVNRNERWIISIFEAYWSSIVSVTHDSKISFYELVKNQKVIHLSYSSI